MYTIKKRPVQNYVAANAQDVASTGVHTTSKAVLAQMDVTRLMAVVDTAIVSTGAVSVKFWRRPTFNSTSSQVSLGTLSIPAGTAAGKVLYKDISPTQINPGEQITFEVLTAATTSGKLAYEIELADSPEAAGNQSNMIASA